MAKVLAIAFVGLCLTFSTYSRASFSVFSTCCFVYLATSRSGFDLLDAAGIRNRGNANVNYLRRSYRTTAEKSISSEAEREQLAFKFMHSPFASLKYIRELEDVSELSTEAIELTKDRRFRNRLAKE